MSNYCACSGGDEEYIIELNQQGPPGPKGDKGDTGFSPTISVLTSTNKEYILNIVNEENSFNTPNLYGEIEKLNADLSNIPNPAIINGVALSSIEDNVSMITMDSSRITTDVDGNLILNATASDEESMEVFNYEAVVNPKDQRLELHDNEGTVKIVATTDNIPTISVATTETAGVVKPDGNTITVTADGTISAVGGDVTAAGDNRFTGDNTFTGKVNIAGGALTVEGLATLNQATAQYLNAVSITSPGEINAVSIKANGLRSDDIQTTENKKYLTEIDVDNQTIQVVNGKLHANIDELGNEVNDLSGRVTVLQTSKQDTLTAGANITIVDNVISATGGGSGGTSIDDSTTSTASTWSSSKINSEITTAVDTINSTKNDNIFDIGKFIVVGSPVITDDGVLTKNDRTSNNIRISLPTLSDNWDIIFPYNRPNQIGWHSVDTIFRFTTNYDKFSLGSQGTNYYIFISDVDGNSYNTEFYPYDGYNTFTDDLIKLSCINGTTLNIYVSKDRGQVWKLGKTITATSKLYICDIENPVFIINADSRDTGASIDLKQFSVVVNGEEVFNGLMESTKPIYDKLASTNSTLSTFQTDTDNNFSAVNSALNEKANLSDLAGYVTVTKYNELLARVVALEAEINGGNA